MKINLIRTTALCLLVCIQSIYAQTQIHPLTNATVVGPIVTTIQEIQSVSGSNLASCNDVSPFNNLTVIVRGRMLMNGRSTFPSVTVGGVVYPQTFTSVAVNQYGRDLAMSAGTGPFSGLIIRSGSCGAPLVGDDMLDALAGDSVEVEGIIEDNSGTGFGGNTQINPRRFTILGLTVTGLPPKVDGIQVEGWAPVTVNVGDLNDNTPFITNKLETGEQYENMFVELRDLTVVEYSMGNNTTNVIDFTTGNRYRIICQDANGNYVQIYDRFKAGRLPLNVQTSSTCGGEVSRGGFLSNVPPIGGKFEYVRGILINIKNQVPNQTCPNVALNSGNPANDKGYQLQPFHPSHYKIAPYNPPRISDVVVNPVAPKPTEPAQVSATIETVDPGISVASATLHFSFDTLNPLSWSSVPMSAQGNTWSASIPSLGFEEGKTVYFYIKANDSRTPALTTYKPAIPATVNGLAIGKEKPALFVIRENGLQIRDVQFTPFADGLSPYLDRVVTLTGVVTSTVEDLGRVTLQQEQISGWGGIFLESNLFLNNVKKGDKITVSGKVTEVRAGSSTFTVLDELTLSAPVVPEASNVRINPLILSFNVLAGAYNFRNHEPYEAMLATVINPTAGSRLFVVDTMPDYPANFAEYRIGADRHAVMALPSTVTGSIRNVSVVGTRVLTGRTPAENSINSQVFPLVATPRQISTSSGANLPSDTAFIRLKNVKPTIATRKIAFNSMSGIVQHSFGNMKLLPRDVFDISGLQVEVADGVFEDVVTTLPGFGVTSTLLTDPTLLYIYPNPAQDYVYVKAIGNSKILLSVYTLSGAKVWYHQLFVDSTTITTSGWNSGVYLMEFVDAHSGAKTYRRLVVTK